MSRTAAGYVFKCKVCGEGHLMTKGEPHDGIRVPCYLYEDKIRSYKKNDFEFWHGMVGLFACMVEAEDE